MMSESSYLEEYTKSTRRTAIYPADKAIQYLSLGLVSEAGEVAGKVKKVIRGDRTMNEVEPLLLAELGDCLWYITRLADEIGVDIETVFRMNQSKLENRSERGAIRGDGDNR